MKSKHTKGPWNVEPCPEHGGKHPLHDHRIVSSPGGWVCVMRDQQAQEADAHLIAAAPQLLTAVAQLLDIVEFELANDPQPDDLTSWHEAIKAGRDSLTKVAGEVTK